MKKWIMVALSCTFGINIALANPPPFLKSGLKQLIFNNENPKLRRLNLGIIVQSLNTRKTLYQYRAHYLFTPASIQKIFTAVASLIYLKPSFQFKTEFLTTGHVQGNTLVGNLYVKFSGDPEFRWKNMVSMILRMRHLGIKKIQGRIYIDNTAYNNVPYPPGWIWDDLSYGFAAPLNSIIINHNKFLLKLTPSQTLGGGPILSSKLPPGSAEFKNNAITTAQYRKNCPLTIYSDDQGYYTLGGCLNTKAGVQNRLLAIRDINRFARLKLRDSLYKHRISHTGKIRFRKTPKNAKLLITYFSPPLSKIMHEMLKDSDNLTTNAVFKKIGQTYYQKAGSWQNSLRALKRLLGPVTGINFKNNLLADGAGLSRYNLITPAQELKLLDYAYKNKTIWPVFYNALPIAGRDGTLKWRMRNLRHHGRVHAKTGSMTGVSSLAGYINSKSRGKLAFVIMVNGFVGKRAPVIKLENHIVEFLAQ